MAIWSILLPFRTFSHLVYFGVMLVPISFPFWYVEQKKSGNPAWHQNLSLFVLATEKKFPYFRKRTGKSFPPEFHYLQEIDLK
jgi:hypothetical protein